MHPPALLVNPSFVLPTKADGETIGVLHAMSKPVGPLVHNKSGTVRFPCKHCPHLVLKLNEVDVQSTLTQG